MRAKLKENPKELEVHGNCNKEKSYLHAEDGVDAALLQQVKLESEIFNAGSGETITVRKICRLVASEMDLLSVKFKYLDGKKGWPRDISYLLLSIERLKDFGWDPKFFNEESVSLMTNWLAKSSLRFC